MVISLLFSVHTHIHRLHRIEEDSTPPSHTITSLLSLMCFILGQLLKFYGVTVRHMHAATAAAAPDHEGSTSATSKGNTRGEQAIYIERTTTLPNALFFSA